MGKSKQSLAAHMRKCKLNPKSSTFEGQNSVLPLSGSPDTTIQPLEEVELEV
jgi:hypothetical protein